MANSLQIHATVRQELGKGASRRLRREHNLIPAVAYGAGKEPQALTLNHNEVIRFLQNEAVYASILTLNVGAEIQQVVLKDIMRHPFKPKVLHLDFMRIDPNEKIHIHVPLHFLHESSAPGVKAGGLVSHLMTDVEVVCLPKYLPSYVEVDVSLLNLDESIHLSQLKLPEGVQSVALNHGNDNAVVSIHLPRAAKEQSVVVAEGENVQAEVSEN